MRTLCVNERARAIWRLFHYPDQPNFPPRYNVAPTQAVPIVRLLEGKGNSRWCAGLIPSWVKDPRTFPLLINARAESVLEKPAFRNAMRRRRCLIPADGFYEWIEEGGRKRPYFVRPKSGEPIAYAGIWETWTGPNGEEVETAAIITTQANVTCAAIHDRMPAIIAPEAFDMWLDCDNVDAKTAETLITPRPKDCSKCTKSHAQSTALPMTRLRCLSLRVKRRMCQSSNRSLRRNQNAKTPRRARCFKELSPD